MKNLPIIGKFLFIMGIFGVFALGVAFYATVQMRAISNGYSALMDDDNSASLYLARASRYFQTARAGIAELEIANTAAENTAAEAVINQATGKFSDFMNQAEAASPENASDIDGLKSAALNVVNNICQNSITAGAAAVTQAQDAAAQQYYLTQCSPAFPAPTAAITSEVSKISGQSQAAEAALAAQTGTTIALTFAGIIAGLVLVMLFGFFAIKAWLVAPVAGLQRVMGRLAGGDLRAEVREAGRRDEIGGMARAVQVFKEQGLERLRLAEEAKTLAAQMEEARLRVEAEREAAVEKLKTVVQSMSLGLGNLAKGDLLFRLNEFFPEEFKGLRMDFNEAMEKLRETMMSVAGNADGIHASAQEITQASDDLSRRTEQQAASLEQTAAALDEITATVRTTATGAGEARDVVTAAKQDAETSGAVVRETVGAMSGIEESSKKIGNIIGVIDEIAFQTNLLALNAGVEAARAGDAGRGFAVVATEVRALAQRSADAAKEIKALISDSSRQVETGVRLVGETGKSLIRIIDQVNRLNALVTAIAASAQEQATGLAEVNTAVNQMDQVTQQNAAMVEQSTAASHALAVEADALARLIAQFRIGKAASPPPPPVKRPPAPAPKPGAALKPQAGKFVLLPKPAGAETADAGWDEF